MRNSTLYLYSLYALNVFLLIVGFYLSFRRRRVYSVLYAGLAAFIILGGIAGAGLMDFEASDLIEGQLYLLLSTGLLLFTCETLDTAALSGKGQRSEPFATRSAIRKYYWVVLAMFAAIFALIIAGGGLSRLELNWSEARSNTGFLEVPANLMAFGAFPALWVALRQKDFRWVLVLGALALVYFEASGSRALLTSVGGAAFLDVLGSRRSLRRRIGILVALSVLGLGVHTLARWMRGFGPVFMYNELVSGHLIEDLHSNVQLDYTGGESGPLTSYYYALHMNPNEPPYGKGTTWLRILLLYVPKEIYPNKPLDLTYQLWSDQLVSGYMNSDPMIETLINKLASGEPGSDHMLLWGDAFLNAGVPGLFIYPVVIGALAILLERAIGKLSEFGLITIGPIVVLFYLWLARGNVVIGFGYLAYIAPFMLLMAAAFRLPILAPRRGSRLTPASAGVAAAAC